MNFNYIKKILFILFIPLFLFSQDITDKETSSQKSVDEHLDEQVVVANEVVKNINKNKYLQENKIKKINDEINYFENRISLNKKEGYALAVKRDELKVLLLKEKKVFNSTLEKITQGKKSYKDQEYFKEVLNKNIKSLEDNSWINYRKDFLEQKDSKGEISKEFVQNYKDLIEQNSQQLFTLKYLLSNISLYRHTNFFIDQFNIQSLIASIDSLEYISTLSDFTSYHFKFSIGEIIVVILIMVFFRLLNTKIITLLSTLLAKYTFKNSDEDFEKYLRKSIQRPLVLALYTLSVHISIMILVKDIKIIDNIIPWINTLYLALFTWAIYSFLTNSITNFAQSLVERYPNVRREMIVFILRITKIVLIILVILFLFSQLGLDIKAIAASLGVGGIAIALASKDTLANFFGSLNIMTDNSFSQGDWIKTDTIEGTVVDIRMRTTRIRTFDNAMITVPNSELANAHIQNYSKRKIGRRIKMKIGITYESKMSDIINLKNDIYEMIHDHPDIATERNAILNVTKKFEAIKREDLQGVKRTLLVFIDEYDNSSINILVYCFSRSPDWDKWLEVKEDVIIKISELVHKNNCEFAYPTQTLHLKNS
ncbi:MAG: mechanosensitive ion channel family protein [Halarcobacter sp.]